MKVTLAPALRRACLILIKLAHCRRHLPGFDSPWRLVGELVKCYLSGSFRDAFDLDKIFASWTAVFRELLIISAETFVFNDSHINSTPTTLLTSQNPPCCCLLKQCRRSSTSFDSSPKIHRQSKDFPELSLVLQTIWQIDASTAPKVSTIVSCH